VIRTYRDRLWLKPIATVTVVLGVSGIVYETGGIRYAAVGCLVLGVLLLLVGRDLAVDTNAKSYCYDDRLGPLRWRRSGGLKEIVGVEARFQWGSEMSYYKAVCLVWENERLRAFPIRYLFFTAADRAYETADEVAISLLQDGFLFGSCAYWRPRGGLPPGAFPPSSHS
jgi:hypothetical protein